MTNTQNVAQLVWDGKTDPLKIVSETWARVLRAPRRTRMLIAMAHVIRQATEVDAEQCQLLGVWCTAEQWGVLMGIPFKHLHRVFRHMERQGLCTVHVSWASGQVHMRVALHV